MIKQSQHIFSSVEKMSEQINTKNSDIISKRENYLKNQEETLKGKNKINKYHCLIFLLII